MTSLIIEKINFVFGLLLAFFLITCSSKVFILAKNNYQTNAIPVIFNQGKVKEFEQLTVDRHRLQEQFEFMVFEKERKETLAELIEILRTQINLSPYDSNLWRQLSYWQSVSGDNKLNVSQKEQPWVLSVVIRLLQWNQKERLFLLSQCVNIINNKQVKSDNGCQQLFHIELGRLGTKNIKRLLNVSLVQWELITQYYSLELGRAQ